ncbi:MAG: hypothetical protein AAF251_07155 [Pseudomonadota bacterium]
MKDIVFEARRSRSRLVLLLGLLGVLSAAALLLPLKELDPDFLGRFQVALRIIGVIGLLVMSAKLPAIIGSPIELRISGAGIWYKPWSQQTVAWESISKITERKINVQRTLCVHLTQPENHKIRSAQRLATSLNKRSGDYGDMNIMIQMTDKTIEEARAAIIQHLPFSE